MAVFTDLSASSASVPPIATYPLPRARGHIPRRVILDTPRVAEARFSHVPNSTT